MLQEGLFDGRIDDLGPNLAQEPFGIRFLVQHEEIRKLIGWGLPRAARGNSEMSWMGLVSCSTREFRNELDGACFFTRKDPFPCAARGNSEMSWMGLVRFLVQHEETQKLAGWGFRFLVQHEENQKRAGWGFRFLVQHVENQK